MQKITTFLWFNNQAEEAMNYYLSVFKNGKVLNIVRWGEGGPGPAGSVMTASFELFGQEFMALNGGPHFSFTPAISLFVKCADQQEVDEFWNKLLEGGEESQCGWLKDKYGLSWQIVPVRLEELRHDKDPRKVQKVMQAMMKMRKIDVAKLEEACES